MGTQEKGLPEESDRVTVKLKRGTWEVEITAKEDKVQQAVESVLAGMASKEPAVIEPESGERHHDTCRGLLLSMWKEGFFTDSRSLSEVHEEMTRRGYHYDRTAVAHTLVDLVRETTLFREGSMRNYRYVQKRPLESSGAGSNADRAERLSSAPQDS